MGLGVLEPKSAGHVPATVLLDQEAAHSEQTTSNLKHGSGRSAHIVLAPQPSEDPNDPLNWSWFQKHLVLGVICFGTIVNAVVGGPLLNAGQVQIAAELNRSVQDIVKLSGYLLLATGALGPFASAISRKVGKRPVLLASSLFSLIGVIIGETATGYNMLLASRVMQGLATSAYESLVLAAIGDLFFVHERGPRVAVVIFLLAAISNGISIIAGVITANLGWHYNYHVLVPFVALQFILCFFFVEETTYRRSHIYDIDTAGSENDLSKLARIEGRVRHIESTESTEEKTEDLERTVTSTSAMLGPPLQRKTFVRRLALYNGIFVHDSIFKMILASVAILLNAAASWTVFVSGIVIAWYVAVAFVSSIIFSSPPYGFTAAGIGYCSTGPLLGGVIASVFMGQVSDPVAKWMTRRNNGIYEPEFRIPLIAVGTATSVAGLVAFGYAVRDTVSVYLICFIWGLMLFGMTIVAVVTTAYALDAFRDYATEIFIMSMVFKNFFYYGLTNFIINWYVAKGATQVFNVMAGITAALCLTSVPMYVYGKRYRSVWHHHNLIKMLRLETDKTGAAE